MNKASFLEMARLPVVLVLINIIICGKQGSFVGGKSLVCEYYNYPTGNGTGHNVTCANSSDYCYAFWKEAKGNNNEMLHRVIFKGCWRTTETYCQDDCTQWPPKYDLAVDGFGFCCCITNMCNVNVTAIAGNASWEYEPKEKCNASCEGGKGLVCEKTVRGIQSGTETCKDAGDVCFVTWEDENNNNGTFHRVLSKGCLEASRGAHSECQQDACIQADGEPYGFCCCNTNLCNANFTAVDDEPTVPPITEKHHSNAFCEGGKCLVCDKTVRGIQNGTESCKNAGDFCFASWEDENARVLSKGCFETYGHGWVHPECQQDACIQADGEPYGFCCCNTNLCNANFTAVDDEPTVPPITEKHHSNGSTKQKIVVACVVSVALVVFITLVVVYIMYKRKHHRGVIRYVKSTE